MSFPNNNSTVVPAVSSTKVMTNGDTVFNIHGDIQIVNLVSECVSTGTAAASTLQWQSAPTVGAAATCTGATASLISAVAGSSVNVVAGQTNAPAITISGANNTDAYPLAIWCPAGALKLVIGTGPTTGTWKHYMLYRPLEADAYVTGV